CRARFDDGRDRAVPSLLVIPAGTGNDFARSQGLPLKVDEGLQLLEAGRLQLRWVDAGDVAGRYFINVGGVGVDAEVAAATNRAGERLPGGGPYVLALVERLRTYRNERVVIGAGGRRLEQRVLLVAGGAGRYCAGGMMILPQADPADGLLDACSGGHRSRRGALV